MNHDMIMIMKIIQTDAVPAAVGPYSQAVLVDGWVYCSGQIGLDTSGVLQEGVEEQMLQIIRNIEAVLEEAGGGLDQVVKTTIFLTNVDDFELVNEIYAVAMGDQRPARSTVVVKELPRGALVEVEMVGKLK